MLQTNGSITVHKTSRLSREQASDLARRLVQINQDYNTLLNDTNAADYIRRSLLNELLERVEAVIAEDIPHASALNLAGRIAFDLSLIKLSRDYFHRAYNLEPQAAAYAVNLANALAMLGRNVEAMDYFHKALKLDKQNLSAFMGIAFCLIQTKQYDKAFLHYRSLISLGHADALVLEHMTQCIENLSCDRYTEELELLMLYLLRVDCVETKRLLPFTADLLTHKYDLANPDCALDLDVLTRDELLIAALETGLVSLTHFEELVTQLRLSILSEAVTYGSLRDELVPCAIAIGIYACHTDYALVLNQDEETEIDRLKIQIANTIGDRALVVEDVAGALILLSMYEALYVQSFSFDLMALELDQWPNGLQNLMQTSLYELSIEHQARYQLFGQTMTELLENGVTRARDRWKPIPSPIRTSFYQSINSQLRPQTAPREWRGKTIRVLLIACGSGEKAFQYATRFNDVEVLGADANQVDMAYAHAQVGKLSVDNLSYAVADYTTPPSDIEPFDYIEFGSTFDYRHADQWLALLAEKGIARFSLPSTASREQTGMLSDLVRARGMHPSLENIRLLRHSILIEKSSDLWTKLFENPGFYSGSGCRDLIFNNQLAFFDLDKSYELLRRIGLVSIKDPIINASDSHVPDHIEVFAAKTI